MSKLCKILKQDLSYCDPYLKTSFHRESKRILKLVADALGLAKGEYDLRSNKGGIAGSGEITLHTDTVYVQIEQSSMGPECFVLMRACDGREDYSGKQNNFAPVEALDDIQGFADRLTLLSKG